MLAQQVAQYKAQNGGKAPDVNALGNMAKYLLTQGTVKGSGTWFTSPTSEPLYQAQAPVVDPKNPINQTPNPNETNFQPQIPGAWRTAFVASYQKIHGITPSDGDVQRAYMMNQGFK
jgi:hypothetical protein